MSFTRNAFGSNSLNIIQIVENNDIEMKDVTTNNDKVKLEIITENKEIGPILDGKYFSKIEDLTSTDIFKKLKYAKDNEERNHIMEEISYTKPELFDFICENKEIFGQLVQDQQSFRSWDKFKLRESIVPKKEENIEVSLNVIRDKVSEQLEKNIKFAKMEIDKDENINKELSTV